MNKIYLKDLVEKINSTNDSKITDYLCEFADIFESIAMNKIDINSHNIEYLRESIKSFISSSKHNDHISTAVWALGKLTDKKEEDYFVELIKKYIDDSSPILYQSMVALSRIDKNMFGSEVGSLFDVQKNQSLAIEYLKKNKTNQKT